MVPAKDEEDLHWGSYGRVGKNRTDMSLIWEMK
jgi:hypothetical protein